MSITRNIAAVAASAVFAGCATTPDVIATYYFPKSETSMSITETLACVGAATPATGKPDGTGGTVSSVGTVTPNTVYSSDLQQPKGFLRYNALSGPFSDSDVGLNFTDDGRLAGVNASSTGQGEAILKNLATFAATVGPAFVAAKGHATSKGVTAPTLTPCQIIYKYAIAHSAIPPNPANPPNPPNPPPNQPNTPKGPPAITLTYSINVLYDYERNGGALLLEQNPAKMGCSQNPQGPTVSLNVCPEATSSPAYIDLMKSSPALVQFTLKIRKATPQVTAAASSSAEVASPNNVQLELNRVYIADLEVDGPVGEDLKRGSVWKGQVPVPVAEYYSLPIPKAALFGGQQFALSLSSYGSISKLEYGQHSGAPDATAAAGVLAKALQGPSEATQATTIQAQSDLIYQQQRLAICKADPKNCPGK